MIYERVKSAVCDDAGDCSEQEVTSAEYVRGSGGWEIRCMAYIAMRWRAEAGLLLPVFFMLTE